MTHNAFFCAEQRQKQIIARRKTMQTFVSKAKANMSLVSNLSNLPVALAKFMRLSTVKIMGKKMLVLLVLPQH